MPTRASIRRFEADIERFADLLDINVGLATRRVTLQVFTGLVQKTPVDTGRAKSNWGINQGAPSPPPSHAVTEQEARSRRKSKTPANAASEDAKALAYASAAVSGIDGSAPVHVTNNLPYITALNDGHSKQAPAGFVQTTVAEVPAEIRSLTS